MNKNEVEQEELIQVLVKFIEENVECDCEAEPEEGEWVKLRCMRCTLVEENKID